MQDETQQIVDGNYKTSQEQLDLGLQKTIFNELLESDLPPEEKLHSRLWQEGLVVVGAGTDTTAGTLTVIHFWLLQKPEILQKLRAELEEVMPNKFDSPKLIVVENLPYMVSLISNVKTHISDCLQNACVNEGLRYCASSEPIYSS
jgi:cytochrome P450